VRLKLSDDEAVMLKQIGKQYPRFLPMLESMRTAELELMATGTDEHFSTYKGRVQCLTEIRQIVRS